MVTALLYVALPALIAVLLFVIAALVFGRGEQADPLPRGASPTYLPEHAVVGDDVRAVRFQQTVRGYKASEVDWTMDRLAAEIDRLRVVVAAHDHELAVPGSQAAAGRVQVDDADGGQ
ncbi:MAG: DivIVA domain-containing protein [Tomitella sp.]|nr:DivIVA domain-containing protein [Tomitella sp.]